MQGSITRSSSYLTGILPPRRQKWHSTLGAGAERKEESWLGQIILM